MRTLKSNETLNLPSYCTRRRPGLPGPYLILSRLWSPTTVTLDASSGCPCSHTASSRGRRSTTNTFTPRGRSFHPGGSDCRHLYSIHCNFSTILRAQYVCDSSHCLVLTRAELEYVLYGGHASSGVGNYTMLALAAEGH